MSKQGPSWSADPLVWGTGSRLFEVFVEPTCPFSARAFGKLDDLLDQVGPDALRVRVWLHSQPWHMFSGVICRAILAASTGPAGKEAAKKLIDVVFSRREEFEFEDHRTGSNLDTTPRELIERLEDVSGIELSAAFQISGLERVLKQHTRYARQNGIHVSPTFMIDGLIAPSISSGDSTLKWKEEIFQSR